MRSILIAFILTIPIIGTSQHFRQIDKIVASDRDTSDQFSWSVDIDGDFAISGALRNSFNSIGINYLLQAGSAYAYQFINGVWVQTQKFTASDRGLSDHFGSAVAINGNFAVVGAKHDGDSIGSGQLLGSAGSAYVFLRNGAGVWTETQKIVAPDRSVGDFFGSSVDIWNNILVVGASNASAPGAPPGTAGAGAVYLFEKNTLGIWVFTQKIFAPNPDIGDNFGFSVSLHGNQLAVGAYDETDDALGNNTIAGAGAAYIFENQFGTWVQVQKLTATNRVQYGNFGWSVSIYNNEILVGAPGDLLDSLGQNSIANAGAAYFFAKNGSTWSLSKKVVARDRGILNRFGGAVAMTDSFAVMGSNSSTDSLGNNLLNLAGAGYIFSKSGTSWFQHQKVVTYDREPNDAFSNPCAISGRTIMLSAISEDEDVNGLNTMPWSGSAYLFKPCFDSDTTYSDTSCVSYISPSGKYIWSSTGTYLDTIRNHTGCDSLLTINLVIQSAATPLQIDTLLLQKPSCYRGMDGQIHVIISGGALPYTISWNNGDSLSAINNLDTGLFKIIVLDNYGCSDSAIFHLSEPDSLTVGLINLANATCHGQNDGIIEISIAGGTSPYTINWSNGDTTKNINHLAAGNYTVTIKDSLGCTRSKTFSIKESDSLILILNNLKNISCFGEKDGSISLAANGGTKPYTFSWSSGQNTSNINQLSHGFYTVTLTDSSGCTTSKEYEIIEPEMLQIFFNLDVAPSCGKYNGELSLNITGGTKPYNAVWNNGQTGMTIKNISDGNYAVTITDFNGCIMNSNMLLNDEYEKTLYFANAFTPNGDNINDVYELKGPSECFTNASFVVFNRWGERVFSTDNPFVEFWDGNINGNNQTKSDVYTIKFFSKEFNHVGFIQVIR